MKKQISEFLWLMRPLTFSISIFSCLFFITMSHRAYGSGQSNPTKPAPASGNVQFADLVAPADQQKPKLPYGEPFTITGDLADVCVVGKAQRDKTTNAISCATSGRKGQTVSDILAATTVGGKYVVSGQETPFTTSQISGDSWSVTVGKLDENTPVTFRFTFSGKLNQVQAATIADQLLTSNDFTSALAQFLAAAKRRPMQKPCWRLRLDRRQPKRCWVCSPVCMLLRRIRMIFESSYPT